MKRICYLVFGICCFLFPSCKPPLPVYFDRPIGTKVQGFDTLIAGNYIPLDDVIDKGTREFTEKYNVRYDKIVPKDSPAAANDKEINYDEAKNIIGIKGDSGKAAIDPQKCDSIFKSFCDLNDLVPAKMVSRVDKSTNPKPQAGIVKITYDRILFISIDSAGRNFRDTLFTLSPSVQLTRYAGKYFLNFKSEFGWEILQMDIWENKFLSARPFYFTNYNSCALNSTELTASTKDIYPNLKPVFKDKKVVGYKAALDPQALLAKFKTSEETVMMMKIR